MTAHFPWYDALWLQSYVKAREFIAQQYPARLAGFVDSMQVLRTRPDFAVQHLSSVFDDPTLARIRTTIASLQPDDLDLNEIKSFGRWIVYNHPVFAELQATLTDRVSLLAGEEVEPLYNFLSMYTKLGHCPLHMDAPQAKWTLDICINQSEPWDIHFSQILPWPEQGVPEKDWQKSILSDPSNHFSTFALQPGEAILFSGSSQWHYRKPLPNRGGSAFCDLLFFHYIPKGTAAIANEHQWPEYFGIPELATLVRNPAHFSRWQLPDAPTTIASAAGTAEPATPAAQ